MIQISEEKREKMSEMCEKMLRYGGKLMQCLEGLEDEGNKMPHVGYQPYDEYEEPDTRGGNGGIEMRMGRGGGMRGGRYGRY